MNEVLISPCTKQKSIKSLKKALVKFFNEIGKKGVEAKIITSKLDDGYISLVAEINGSGFEFVGVRFVNPESIINVIQHCVSLSRLISLGIDAENINENDVVLTLHPKMSLTN